MNTLHELVQEATRSDIPPARNLGTFVSPVIDTEICDLVSAWAGHNLVNRAEYAGLTALENRCMAMLTELWHGADSITGASTSGSSEAAVVAASALLRRWRRRGGHGTPNLVLGPTAHICWLRFCAFRDVEARVLPLHPESPVVSPGDVAAACDEDTIGVVATLGSPELGRYDPVEEITKVLDGLHAERGLDIPVHVDAASGGFVAPFLQPRLVWDFRLDRVASINASGHKYGLTTPAVGWLLWRTTDSAMDELAVAAPYIGDGLPEPTLSFSRSAVPVLEQYLQLMRFGRHGYRATHGRSRAIANGLARQLAAVPTLRVIGTGADLPVVSFTARDPEGPAVSDLANALAESRWHIPIYRLREPMETADTGRIVVRADLTAELATQLAHDLGKAIDKLNARVAT